jgi:hypothetical protein
MISIGSEPVVKCTRPGQQVVSIVETGEHPKDANGNEIQNQEVIKAVVTEGVDVGKVVVIGTKDTDTGYYNLYNAVAVSDASGKIVDYQAGNIEIYNSNRWDAKIKSVLEESWTTWGNWLYEYKTADGKDAKTLVYQDRSFTIFENSKQVFYARDYNSWGEATIDKVLAQTGHFNSQQTLKGLISTTIEESLSAPVPADTFDSVTDVWEDVLGDVKAAGVPELHTEVNVPATTEVETPAPEVTAVEETATQVTEESNNQNVPQQQATEAKGNISTESKINILGINIPLSSTTQTTTANVGASSSGSTSGPATGSGNTDIASGAIPTTAKAEVPASNSILPTGIKTDKDGNPQVNKDIFVSDSSIKNSGNQNGNEVTINNKNFAAGVLTANILPANPTTRAAIAVTGLVLIAALAITNPVAAVPLITGISEAMKADNKADKQQRAEVTVRDASPTKNPDSVTSLAGEDKSFVREGNQETVSAAVKIPAPQEVQDARTADTNPAAALKKNDNWYSYVRKVLGLDARSEVSAEMPADRELPIGQDKKEPQQIPNPGAGNNQAGSNAKQDIKNAAPLSPEMTSGFIKAINTDHRQIETEAVNYDKTGLAPPADNAKTSATQSPVIPENADFSLVPSQKQNGLNALKGPNPNLEGQILKVEYNDIPHAIKAVTDFFGGIANAIGQWWNDVTRPRPDLAYSGQTVTASTGAVPETTGNRGQLAIPTSQQGVGQDKSRVGGIYIPDMSNPAVVNLFGASPRGPPAADDTISPANSSVASEIDLVGETLISSATLTKQPHIVDGNTLYQAFPEVVNDDPSDHHTSSLVLLISKNAPDEYQPGLAVAARSLGMDIVAKEKFTAQDIATISQVYGGEE